METPEPEHAQTRFRMLPEERRRHILDAAQKLFFAQGWDAVTIADILREAGISKGGFYHHFAAKEDLLSSIVQRFTMEALASAEAARAAAFGGALARFNAFLAETNRWKADQGAHMKLVMSVTLRPGNDVLFSRITASATMAAMPVLLDMIVQGTREGVFDVPDIDLAAEAIMALAQGRRSVLEAAFNTALSGDIDQATGLLNDRMVAEGALIDRLLGVPRGSIALSDPEEYRRMLKAVTRD